MGDASLTNPHLFEKITGIDPFALIHNSDLYFKTKKRVVHLACGHALLSSAHSRARCIRCEEMLKRSIETGEEDYDSFRNGRTADTMEWVDDPMRVLNERNFHRQ